jgi:serine/threonine protein phosphatase PrpC
MEQASVAQVELTVSGRTDLGRVRKNNEDAFLVADLSIPGAGPPSGALAPLRVGGRGVLVAVADGMGGSQAGEVASALALDALRRGTAEASAGLGPDAALKTGVERANDEVREAARAPERAGMGATLTACLVHGARAYLAQVGDSRGYVLRRGRLVQLTNDQSWRRLLVEIGKLTPEAAKQSFFRNVVLQAIGKTPQLSVEMSRLELRCGDRLLLCSDGLSGAVRDDDIASVISRARSIDEACDRLVGRANENGGRDNTTVVLVAVGGSGVPEPDEHEAFAGTFETLIPFELAP